MDLLVGVLEVELAGAGPHRVVLDLSGTTAVDDAGMLAFQQMRDLAHTVPTTLRLIHPQPLVRHQLATTGLDILLLT